MPVQEHNYPAMYHRAQTGCDLGGGGGGEGNVHSHRFFLVKSVCNGWTLWTTEPCCQLCGHRGELFTQGKTVGRKGRCWWVQILYVLRDLATTRVCPDCSELTVTSWDLIWDKEKQWLYLPYQKGDFYAGLHKRCQILHCRINISSIWAEFLRHRKHVLGNVMYFHCQRERLAQAEKGRCKQVRMR